MKIIFLSLLVCLSVCSGQVFIREPGAGFSWANGCDFFGDDLLKLIDVSGAVSCGFLCVGTAGCTHFTFNSETRDCWVKRKRGGADEARRSNGIAACGFVDNSLPTTM